MTEKSKVETLQKDRGSFGICESSPAPPGLSAAAGTFKEYFVCYGIFYLTLCFSTLLKKRRSGLCERPLSGAGLA